MNLLVIGMKRLLAACGCKVTRIADLKTMRNVLMHTVRLGFSPSVVIDVGVAYGTRDLYESFPNATFLLVEPLAEWEPSLKKIQEKYNAVYVLAAAGPSPGSVCLNVHPKLSGSSVLKDSDGSEYDGVERTVPVVTVDDLVTEKNLKGPFLLKLDVQGFELAVLDGALKTLEDTELVVLEVSMFAFAKGGPEFFEVVSYMKDKGFVAYDFFGWNSRPLDSALGQLDVAFVKENGLFRKSSSYATKLQRDGEIANSGVHAEEALFGQN